jgi:hypothetical protein
VSPSRRIAVSTKENTANRCSPTTVLIGLGFSRGVPCPVISIAGVVFDVHGERAHDVAPRVDETTNSR